MCSKGNYSKAFKSLFPGTPAPSNDATLHTLSGLHPFTDTSEQFSREFLDFVSNEIIVITEDSVRSYIHGADYLTGPGPFQNKVDYMKQCMGRPNCPIGNEYVKELTWLSNFIINEKLPEPVSTMLECTSLMALVKDQSSMSLRPIAMGDSIRKMSATLAIRSLTSRAQTFLEGVNFGIATLGAEKVFHAIMIMRDKHPSWDTLSLDEKNAFNLIKRSLVAGMLMTHFPSLANYFKTFYAHASSLLFKTPNSEFDYLCEFLSCEGVQQGDPLAPFFFCLASFNFFLKIKELAGEGIAPAYFDDCNAVVPVEEGVRILQYAQTVGPDYGIHLQPAKTAILLGKCATREEALNRYQKYKDALNITEDVAKKCIHIHLDDAENQSHHITLDKQYGIKILGAPVGSDTFIKNWLDIKLLQIAREGEEVFNQITTAQIQWNLFYFCTKNKANYLFRTLPPRLTKDFAIKFDLILRKWMEKHLKIELLDITWSQAKLNFEDGGHGIGDAQSVSYTAFIASSISVFESVKLIVGDNSLAIQESHASQWCKDVYSSIAFFNQSKVGDRMSIDELFAVKGPGLQHLLSDSMQKTESKKFYSTYASPANKARRISIRSSSSAGFLLATPCRNVTLMDNNEWIIANRLRLGLPLQVIPTNLKCICKEHSTIDQDGFHFFVCKNGGERQATHNSISNVLLSLSRSAGFLAKTEPMIDRTTGLSRGDLLIAAPGLTNENLPETKDKPNYSNIIVDVRVSFPCSPSYVNRASRFQGATADAGYADKISKYHTLDLGDQVLVPVSIESFGHLHKSVKGLISSLCYRASEMSGIPHSVLVNYWTNRLSATLQKNIAKMMLSRVDRIVSSLPPLQNSPAYVPSFQDYRSPF